jgi:hypothetical protein
VIAHHPDSPGRNRDVKGQIAGFVTRIEVRLLHRDIVDGQETTGITAHHVIPRESDDTLDVIALVQIDGDPRGHQTQEPAHH